MVTIKTKEDIAILREGGRRHAEILRVLSAMVKPGLPVIELENKAREMIDSRGDVASFLNFKPRGARRAYPAALCVSINDEVVHGIPNEGEKILKEGDIVSLDLGLTHKGLVTDSAVTVAVGKVAPELEKLIAATKEALMAGIKAAKGGKRVSDISRAIEMVGRRYGFGVIELLGGHGVGYSVHEEPCIPNYDDGDKGPVLKPGMVLAIEPQFNIGTKDVYLDDDDYTYRTADGLPSAHFEHTVVITKSGAEILTA